MKVFGWLVVIQILLMGFTVDTNDFLILTSKRFIVKGSTSIGSFDCSYNLTTKDTLFLNRKGGLSYKIPIKEFGCGNFLLNRDFRKTLNEKEFPFVWVNISQVKRFGYGFQYNLSLDIAGEKKVFNNLGLVREGKHLKGNVDLKFSDFNLTPPSKLGGAIKVNEEIKLSIMLFDQ